MPASWEIFSTAWPSDWAPTPLFARSFSVNISPSGRFDTYPWQIPGGMRNGEQPMAKGPVLPLFRLLFVTYRFLTTYPSAD
jgi:hypothetical protein